MTDDPRAADLADAAVIRALGVLAGAPMRARVAVIVVSSALALWLDWITGPDASLLLAFTITVALAAWILTPRWPAQVTALVLSLGSGLETVLQPSSTTAASIIWINAGLRSASLIILATVVSALRSHLARVERVAQHDVLTGVASRHAILELLDRTSRRPRESDLPLSVVYFDLDGLKRINDRDGHAAGDELIRRFTVVVGEGIRSVDRLGRVGGDEFLLVCPGAGDAEITAIMHRLTTDARLPAVSWGVATTTQPADRATLLAAADAGMYTTKSRSDGPDP